MINIIIIIIIIIINRTVLLISVHEHKQILVYHLQDIVVKNDSLIPNTPRSFHTDVE